MQGLGINGGWLLGQIVNFLIVFGAIALLAWRPLLRAMDARSERIAKGLEDARAAEQARANAEREAERLKDQKRIEAGKLIDEARIRAEEQAKALIDEANKEAADIRTRAHRDAEEERNAQLGEMRSQIAQLAIAAAQRVIGDTLVDPQKAKAIVSDFFARPPVDVHGLGENVEVTSALPLTDAEKRQIQSLTGAQEVTNKVDPGILGGLVLRSGDRVVDASVRSNLQGLALQIR